MTPKDTDGGSPASPAISARRRSRGRQLRAKTTASNRKYHRGFGFDLWTNRGAWFWQLADRACGAGTIGSALTENEALREAHTAVEEVSARCVRGVPGRVSSPATTVISQCSTGLAVAVVDNSTGKLGCETGDC
jgi:hypothetical protein